MQTVKTLQLRKKSIYKIVLYYALFGLIWIYSSDTVLGWLVSEAETFTRIAIFKGFTFIAVTSCLLYYLIKRYDKLTLQSEQAAIAGEKRFKDLFHKLADPIYIADKSSHVIAVNDAACTELGYDHDELLAMQVADIDTDPQTPRLFATYVEKLKEIPALTFETTHRRKDGSTFPVEVNITLIDIDSQPAVMGVARNISKRKHTQNCMSFLAQTVTLQSGENFFHKLAEFLSESLAMDYICIDFLESNNLTARTVAIYFDGKFEDNVSYTLHDTPCGEVVDKSICCYSEGVRHQFPNDKILQEMLAESYIGTVLWGTNNKQIGLIAAIGRKPLKNRELAEETLQLVSVRAAAELERSMYEQERLSLERQVLHAQKLESLGVLAGGIAHDFNNILTSIVGNTDLALMKLPPESPCIDNLRRVESSAAKATDLAKQMLAYSGKGRFVVEPIDLNRLLEEMLHILEVSISKHAVLRLNLVKILPSVEVDATQIRQVIMNLIINASEAIGEKSGVISITTGCMDCDSSYLKDVWLDENIKPGLYVYLEVSDTGCGMTKDTLKNMFDPFFTTKFTGRGLGMAAVLGIMRGHKGAIKVYSELGKGSTIKILLPASDKPHELFNGTAYESEWRGSGIILLVDDEETIRGIGREMLTELGFEVITAKNGREALEIFNKNMSIVAVILDLTMPHMDGEQCFRELRRIDPHLKVIMSSGYNEHEVNQKFVGKGLAGFIQKPYKLSTLRDVISKILI